MEDWMGKGFGYCDCEEEERMMISRGNSPFVPLPTIIM